MPISSAPSAGDPEKPRPAASQSPRKTKVLHILYGMVVGGMEGRVARLAAGLDPEKFDITILTFRASAERTVSLPPHVRLEFFEIPSGIHFGRLLGLRDYIRGQGFDIVHTHNWGSMFYGVLAAKMAGVPVVFHGEHGLEGNEATPWKRLWAQRLLGRLADRIVAVNPPIADHVIRAWKLPPARVVSIPNGVDLSRYRPAEGRGAGPIVFGTMTRFRAVKNLPCLVEAFRLFAGDSGGKSGGKSDGKSGGKNGGKNGGEEARLVMVGTGPDFGSVEKLCESGGLMPLVSLPGDSARPEDHYRGLSVYVNTSIYEGMSNTILEAMACGLPVIASDVPGNREWLREPENALFFKSGDAADLADKMRRLSGNPELARKMGAGNRARVEAEFDNRNFIASYERAYRECLAQARTRAG